MDGLCFFVTLFKIEVVEVGVVLLSFEVWLCCIFSVEIYWGGMVASIGSRYFRCLSFWEEVIL